MPHKRYSIINLLRCSNKIYTINKPQSFTTAYVIMLPKSEYKCRSERKYFFITVLASIYFGHRQQVEMFYAIEYKQWTSPHDLQQLPNKDETGRRIVSDAVVVDRAVKFIVYITKSRKFYVNNKNSIVLYCL